MYISEWGGARTEYEIHERVGRELCSAEKVECYIILQRILLLRALGLERPRSVCFLIYLFKMHTLAHAKVVDEEWLLLLLRSVCGGVCRFVLCFLGCLFPFANASKNGPPTGTSATPAAFFRSCVARRSLFFFALVLRGVRFLDFYTLSTLILAFVILPRFVLKRNCLFCKLQVNF